ncbi:hypothetical protein HMPREF0103_0556 [Bacteroides sp. 2_1_33B]|nr:hypothetical protein HMPREF0103_0556 [Bacteroides sp. 2_1_33B]
MHSLFFTKVLIIFNKSLILPFFSHLRGPYLSQRAQRRREYQPPAQQVQGAGRGVDESESIAPIAASAASRMSSRRESAASRKRLAKASRRKWGKGGRGLRGSVGRVMGRLFLGRVRS